MFKSFKISLIAACAVGGLSSVAMGQDTITAAQAQSSDNKITGTIPLEVLAELPFMQSPRISPNGMKIALALGAGDTLSYGILDLAKPGSPPQIFAKSATYKEGGDKEIGSWRWIGDDNLVFTLSSRENLFGQRVDIGRLVGFNVKTGKTTPIAWDNATGNASTILHHFKGTNEILLSRQTNKYGTERFFLPEVVRVNIETGKIIKVVEMPNPIVGAWAADSKGVIRMGFGGDGDSGKDRMLYRSGQGDTLKTVQVVVDKDFVGKGIRPEIFLEEPDQAIVSTNEAGYNAIYKANLKTMQLGEKLFSVPGYDAGGAIADKLGTKVMGYSYATDRLKYKWTDGRLAEIQKLLHEQFGAGNVTLTSFNEDYSRIVFYVANSSQPGGYYLFDTNSGKMSVVGWAHSSIKDAQVNPVKMIKYKASDGLEIEAVLTMPRLRANTKNLPVVALVHGGPYGVRDYANYDDWAQTIAEQGYVVVQPNYRGSGGYGTEFVKKGRQNGFGTRMQDDVNDVIDHLAAQGIVDSKRACIMGWSYGGYAAARGAQRDPARWKCAIAGAGVYDLPMMRAYDEKYLGSFGAGYLAKGADELSTVSPARNTDSKWSPILVAHGVRDPRVPIAQGRTLVARLKSSGKVKGTDYDYIEQPRNGHYSNFFTKAERIEWLGGAANWLSRFNPAYVAADSDKPASVDQRFVKAK